MAFTLVECFDAERNTCVVTPACGLRNPLQEALLAFLAVLDGYSLADLVSSPLTFRRMRRPAGFHRCSDALTAHNMASRGRCAGLGNAL